MSFPRPIIYIAAVVILDFLLFGFLIYPKSQELAAVRKNISARNLEIEQRTAYYVELDRINTELAGYKRQINKMKQALPAELSLPSLFNFLEKTSSQSGVLLKTVSPVTSNQNTDNPSITENNLNISVMGSYSSFKSFLLSLEQSAKIIEIEDISFTSPEEEIMPFTFNMRLKTFSY